MLKEDFRHISLYEKRKKIMVSKNGLEQIFLTSQTASYAEITN